MITIDKKTNGIHYHIREFSSLQEVENYIRTTDRTPTFKYCRSSESKGDKHWYGTSSLDEALEMLKTGWTDKSKELEEKLGKKFSMEQTQVTRQKSVYDVVGGNASVPRYLQGVPTNMIRQVRVPVKEKVVTINYNIGFNCGITGAQITQKAIDCLSYVKKLEGSGTRVNLNLMWVSYKHTDYVAFVIPVKKSSERISLAKMSFCLCNPAILRRIGFALMERESAFETMDYKASFTTGYGRSLSSIGIEPKEKAALDMILSERKMSLFQS